MEARLKAVQKERQEAKRAELAAAAEVYKLFKAKGKPWVPADSGFVCSLTGLEEYLEGVATAQELKKSASTPGNQPSNVDIEAMLAQSEAMLAELERNHRA